MKEIPREFILEPHVGPQEAAFKDENLERQSELLNSMIGDVGSTADDIPNAERRMKELKKIKLILESGLRTINEAIEEGPSHTK